MRVCAVTDREGLELMMEYRSLPRMKNRCVKKQHDYGHAQTSRSDRCKRVTDPKISRALEIFTEISMRHMKMTSEESLHREAKGQKPESLR